MGSNTVLTISQWDQWCLFSLVLTIPLIWQLRKIQRFSRGYIAKKVLFLKSKCLISIGRHGCSVMVEGDNPLTKNASSRLSLSKHYHTQTLYSLTKWFRSLGILRPMVIKYPVIIVNKNAQTFSSSKLKCWNDTCFQPHKLFILTAFNWHHMTIWYHPRSANWGCF